MLRRTPFYFLRHGQTDWNVDGLCQGQIDVPLNPMGVAQAARAKIKLAEASIVTICCSPLRRARATGEIINDGREGDVVVIDELQEIAFGSAEGRPLFSDDYDFLIRNAAAHGGERTGAFINRAIAGINRALDHQGPVLVVAHGGTFWAIQSHVDLAFAGDMTNGVPIRLEPRGQDASKWTMSFM